MGMFLLDVSLVTQPSDWMLLAFCETSIAYEVKLTSENTLGCYPSL